MALPLLSILGRHSVNAAREIRHSALNHLQRLLLGSPLTNEAEQAKVEEVFNRVIFPLMDELLRPQVASKDPQGMAETRLRGSALLCKVFMQLELRESRAKTDFRLLWIQVLDLLDRLMNVSRGDQLVCRNHYCQSAEGLSFPLVRSRPRILEKYSLGYECRWHSGPTRLGANRFAENSLVEYS